MSLEAVGNTLVCPTALGYYSCRPARHYIPYTKTPLPSTPTNSPINQSPCIELQRDRLRLTSSYPRTQHTASIVGKTLGCHILYLNSLQATLKLPLETGFELHLQTTWAPHTNTSIHNTTTMLVDKILHILHRELLEAAILGTIRGLTCKDGNTLH